MNVLDSAKTTWSMAGIVFCLIIVYQIFGATPEPLSEKMALNAVGMVIGMLLLALPVPALLCILKPLRQRFIRMFNLVFVCTAIVIFYLYFLR